MNAPAKRRSCQHCGRGFTPDSHLQKYCNDECSYGAQLRKMRTHKAEEQAKILASWKHVAEAKPVTLKRASTLAETEDIPAQSRDRGEQLTGACSATVQADGPCR